MSRSEESGDGEIPTVREAHKGRGRVSGLEESLSVPQSGWNVGTLGGVGDRAVFYIKAQIRQEVTTFTVSGSTFPSTRLL